MKYLIQIIIFLVPGFVFSQRENDGTYKTDNYVIIRPCVVIPFDLINQKLRDNNAIIARKNLICRFIEENKEGDWIVEFLEDNFYLNPNPNNKEKESTEYQTQKKEILLFITPDSIDRVKGINKQYFLIKREDTKNKLLKWYSTNLVSHLFNFKGRRRSFDGTTVSVGVLTIPFKARFEVKNSIGEKVKFDFSSGISLGTTVGLRQRISHTNPVYANFIFYTGISSVPLNSLNSKVEVDQPRNEAAFTIATGIMLDINSIQLGLMVGWDRIANQEKVNWIYYNKPWFSLGLGAQLFSIGSK